MRSITRIITSVAGIFLAGSLFVSAVSCNNNTTAGNETGAQQTVTIDDFSFSPLDLNANAGEIIRVMNNDASVHTVTSQSAPDAFDNSGDFDSGLLSPGDEGSITIPIDAMVGEVFHFYCDTHLGSMTTPNGTIAIVAP